MEPFYLISSFISSIYPAKAKFRFNYITWSDGTRHNAGKHSCRKACMIVTYTIFTARIRRMGEGNVFSLFTSGGGDTHIP